MAINRRIFFDGIRQQPFAGKLNVSQVAGVSAILDEFERRQRTDLRHLAYELATAKWETAHTMQPITERGPRAYLQSKKYWPWIGRGYVQLTWERNYRTMTQRLNAAGFDVSLTINPELALDPKIAAFVMFDGMENGVFTGKKLSDYFNKTTTDWLNARRIINGTDHAADIAAIAKAFFTDLTVAAA